MSKKYNLIKLNKKLIKGGFKVIENQTEIEISKSLINRYEDLPNEYLEFLRKFKEITNKEDTAWFNLNNEYIGITENEFKWNEYELMSLEWSEDDDEIKKVQEFWNNHVPIIMSVKDEYQFLGICLEKEKYGEIIHGREPEFEKVKKICNNFYELIDLLEKKKLKNIV